MKKYLVYLFVFGLSLGWIGSASATSGACSNHGGVNCSAGSDSDGSVICYDGWRNSSVSYSSMVMCGGSLYTNLGTSVPSTVSQAPATTANLPAGTLEGEFVATSCPAFSERSTYPNCKCRMGFFLVENSCMPVQLYCSGRYGQASEWDFYGKSCACKNGFVMDAKTHSCRSLLETCQEKLGTYATIELPDRCSCAQGASIDGTTGKCESNVTLNKRTAPTAPIAVPVPDTAAVTIPAPPFKTPAPIAITTPKVSVAPKKRVTAKVRTNVRTQPSLKAKVLGIAPRKASYEVLEQKNGWVRIQFNGKSGWLMGTYVNIK